MKSGEKSIWGFKFIMEWRRRFRSSKLCIICHLSDNHVYTPRKLLFILSKSIRFLLLPWKSFYDRACITEYCFVFHLLGFHSWVAQLDAVVLRTKNLVSPAAAPDVNEWHIQFPPQCNCLLLKSHDSGFMTRDASIDTAGPFRVGTWARRSTAVGNRFPTPDFKLPHQN